MERNIQPNWNLLVEEAIRRRRERKISQRRLAAVADVSQPTISRFEQRKEDIQLSSAIKVLDASGLVERQGLSLRTRIRGNSEYRYTSLPLPLISKTCFFK